MKDLLWFAWYFFQLPLDIRQRVMTQCKAIMRRQSFESTGYFHWFGQ